MHGGKISHRSSSDVASIQSQAFHISLTVEVASKETQGTISGGREHAKKPKIRLEQTLWIEVCSETLMTALK